MNSEILYKLYSINYFLSKLILVKTKCKTYNIELLTIIKIFQIWQYY